MCDLQEIKLDSNFCPIKNKLFSNDVFSYNKGVIEVIHSSIRNDNIIPAVLILQNNKTYGRQPHKSGKGKLLYKCIPDNIQIPSFLVPYEIKNIGFSKTYINMYVTIKYDHWEDDNKHPIASIHQNIGSIDILCNFYEYQLYCKSLNVSIQKFTKDVSHKIQNNPNIFDKIIEKYPFIEDRTKDSINTPEIFSIDSSSTSDYDDAFSICEKDGKTILSIYISNVTIWMDYLQLWNSFSKRISTIYLPDKKRPMIPSILSENLCSLIENTKRISFLLDITLNMNNEEIEIENMKYTNAVIKVNKNHVYESKDLLKSPNYIFLLNIVKLLSKKYKYMQNITNSYDVVSYLMIFMNYHTARELMPTKAGIFRSAIIKRDVIIPSGLPPNVEQFIKFWNNTSSLYINFSEVADTIKHQLLDLEAYIQITSPIRRLVDILNMLIFQKNKNIIQLSNDSDLFYNKWIQELDYINTTMKAVRKIQNDCSLLDMCINNPELMKKEYEGYVFDKLVRDDLLYQYIVYIPSLNISSRITIRLDLENYSLHKWNLFIFNNEEKFKKKIRLQIV
jgi:exoribonuclease R